MSAAHRAVPTAFLVQTVFVAVVEAQSALADTDSTAAGAALERALASLREIRGRFADFRALLEDAEALTHSVDFVDLVARLQDVCAREGLAVQGGT